MIKKLTIPDVLKGKGKKFFFPKSCFVFLASNIFEPVAYCKISKNKLGIEIDIKTFQETPEQIVNILKSENGQFVPSGIKEKGRGFELISIIFELKNE